MVVNARRGTKQERTGQGTMAVQGGAEWSRAEVTQGRLRQARIVQGTPVRTQGGKLSLAEHFRAWYACTHCGLRHLPQHVVLSDRKTAVVHSQDACSVL